MNKRNIPSINEMCLDAKTRRTLKAVGLRNFSQALRLLGTDFTACADPEFALGLAQQVQHTLASPTSWQDLRQSGACVADFHRTLRANAEFPAPPPESIPPEPITEQEDAPILITTRADDPVAPIEAAPESIADEPAETRHHDDIVTSSAPEICIGASSTVPIAEQMESPAAERKRSNPFGFSRTSASPSEPNVLDRAYRRGPGRPPKFGTASSNLGSE